MTDLARTFGPVAGIILLVSCQSEPSNPPASSNPAKPESAVTAPTSTNGLECELSAEPQQKLADGLSLTLRVKNVVGEPRQFCDYHTPFEGIRNDILRIDNAKGEALDYRGMMAKRAAPGPDDYLTVQPNGARNVTFEVTDEYPITAGTFTVTFKGHSSNDLPDSNTIEVTLE